jgi:hypothetical protein
VLLLLLLLLLLSLSHTSCHRLHLLLLCSMVL